MSILQRYRKNSSINKLYKYVPVFLQNFIYSAFGSIKLKEANTFEKKYFGDFDKEEKKTKTERELDQFKKLIKLLNYAKLNSTYYQNIKLEDFKSIADIKKLPILTKIECIENFDLICAKGNEEFYPVKESTGGTTGSTLTYLMDRTNYEIKETEVLHYWKRHGYKLGCEKTIMYRAGVLVANDEQMKHPWRFDHARKMLYLSSYYSSSDLYQKYYELLKEWKPSFMHFLPSAAYLFAKYLNENNLTIQIKMAFSASEMLHSFQKIEIEKAFNCRVYDHYGHREPGIYVAGQCTQNHYHIYTNNVIAEVLGDGSLLETALNNYSFPLIRYKVGDLVDGIHENCSCGILTPFFKTIQGRESSIVVTNDGRIISTIGFDQIFRDSNVILGQIIQQEVGALEIHLVPSKNFNDADKARILKNTIDRMGDSTQITIKLVEKLEYSNNNKFNLVISRLKKIQ